MAEQKTGIKEYTDPTIETLGTVVELTQKKPAKCGGSGDAFLPTQLSKTFAFVCE